MGVSVNADGWLLLWLAVVCTSPRHSLLWVLFVSVLLLLCHLFVSVLQKFALPAPTGVRVLFAAGAGGALYLLLRSAFPDAAFLAAEQPYTVLLWLACGVAADNRSIPAARTLPALLLLGVLRELLAEGTLWGIRLLPAGLAPALGNGAGGLLLAALLLWAFGLHPPTVQETDSPLPALTSAGLVVAGAGLGVLTAPLPPLYAVWATALAVGVIASLLPARWDAGAWLTLAPAAALLTRDSVGAWQWTAPLLLGVATIAALAVASSLYRRCRLSPLPRRFAGTPAALAVAGTAWCVATAL